MTELFFKRTFAVAAGGNVPNALVGDPLANLPEASRLRFYCSMDVAGGLATVRIDARSAIIAGTPSTEVAPRTIDIRRDLLAKGVGEKRANVTLFLDNPTVGIINFNVQVEGDPIPMAG